MPEGDREKLKDDKTVINQNCGINIKFDRTSVCQ
jgi:hypothetical protein